MIEQLLKFVFESDQASILHIIGRWLLAFFVFLYKTWFGLLIKTSTLFVNETHLIKAIAAAISFVVATYTIFCLIKELINLLLKLTWPSTLNVLKRALYKSPVCQKSL
jgi:hypothetical protein